MTTAVLSSQLSLVLMSPSDRKPSGDVLVYLLIAQFGRNPLKVVFIKITTVLR